MWAIHECDTTNRLTNEREKVIPKNSREIDTESGQGNEHEKPDSEGSAKRNVHADEEKDTQQFEVLVFDRYYEHPRSPILNPQCKLAQKAKCPVRESK